MYLFCTLHHLTLGRTFSPDSAGRALYGEARGRAEDDRRERPGPVAGRLRGYTAEFRRPHRG